MITSQKSKVPPALTSSMRSRAGKSQKLFNGFTLIEMIVVTAMIIIISTISVNLLFGILKGSLKAEIVKNTKQNGNYALSVMERMIRSAKEVACDTSTIVVTTQDGSETSFIFLPTNISSGSANLITSDYYDVLEPSFSCDEPVGEPKVVTIKFTLSRGASSLRSEEKVSIPFQTSVSLRNY